MRLIGRVLGVALAVLAGVPAAAQAPLLAYTSRDIHLRAGPARDFPVVAILRTGTAVSIQACLDDYRWCDVVAGPDRGWVYAKNIVYPWQGQNVPVIGYGAVIGIGIVVFSLGTYWDAYYRARPWYPQAPIWIERHRPAIRHLPPRPLPPGPGVVPGPRPPPPPLGGPRPPLPPPGSGQRPPPAPGAGPHRPAPSIPGAGAGPQPPHAPRAAEGPRPPARPGPAPGAPAPGDRGHRPDSRRP